MLKVKGWSEFQHYKGRRPPWIKLHRSLLDNRDFVCLPLASRALAPCIWLLASETDDGTVTSCVAELAFRLRCSEADVVSGVKPLIDARFLVGELDFASSALAERKQVARPETEGETETETERKRLSAHAPNWNREAAEDYREVYGADPPTVFFAHVKPVAKRYGWSRTRPALKAYMAETPIEFLNVAKCLAAKVEGVGPVRARGQPNGRTPTAADLTRTAVQEVLDEEEARRDRQSGFREGPGGPGVATAAVVGSEHVGRLLPRPPDRDG